MYYGFKRYNAKINMETVLQNIVLIWYLVNINIDINCILSCNVNKVYMNIMIRIYACLIWHASFLFNHLKNIHIVKDININPRCWYNSVSFVICVICVYYIPHVNSPYKYKTSIDERLIFYTITCCYSDGEYCHSFAIAAGDIVKY